MVEKPHRSPFRGSPKHKARPAEGRKGTLCPEWTHAAGNEPLGNDIFAHTWAKTVAHELFLKSEESPTEPGRKFATKNGMAFEAKPTNDGTWHGYPVPWEAVPSDLKDKWRDEGRVKRSDLRRYLSKARDDYKWPLESDDD